MFVLKSSIMKGKKLLNQKFAMKCRSSMLDPDEDSQFKLTYGVSSSGLAIQEEQHGLQMDQQSSKTAKLEKMHKMDMLMDTHPVIHTPPVIHMPTLIDIAKIKKQALCEGWTVMQFQLALQYAGWCKPLAIQDAGWPKPLPNYSPHISSWSSHDWSSHDWEHVHPNTIRDVDSDDPCEIAEQPDEEPGVQCEDYTIVELPAKREGTTEVVSASSGGGSVETYDWEHVPPNTITMVDI